MFYSLTKTPPKTRFSFNTKTSEYANNYYKNLFSFFLGKIKIKVLHLSHNSAMRKDYFKELESIIFV